jgi:hypothetical protein
MDAAVFEPVIPASERSQTHAEDCAVTEVNKLALLSVHNEGISLCFLQSVLKLTCWCINLGITKSYCVTNTIFTLSKTNKEPLLWRAQLYSYI